MRPRAARRAWAVALGTSFGIHGVLAASLAMLPTPDARRAVETRIDVQIAPEGATELVRDSSATAAPAAVAVLELDASNEAAAASGPVPSDDAAAPADAVAALIEDRGQPLETARQADAALPAPLAPEQAAALERVAPQALASPAADVAAMLAGAEEAGAELRGSVDDVEMATAAAGEAEVAAEARGQADLPVRPAVDPVAAASGAEPAAAPAASPTPPPAAVAARTDTVVAAGEAAPSALSSSASSAEVPPQPAGPEAVAVAASPVVTVPADTPSSVAAAPAALSPSAVAPLVIGGTGTVAAGHAAPAPAGAAVASVSGGMAVMESGRPQAAAVPSGRLVIEAEPVAPSASAEIGPVRTGIAGGAALAPSAPSAPAALMLSAPDMAVSPPPEAVAGTAGTGGTVRPVEAGPALAMSPAPLREAAVAPRGGIMMGDGTVRGGGSLPAPLPEPVTVTPVEPGEEVATSAPAPGEEAAQNRDVAVLMPARPDAPDARSQVIDPRERIIEHLSGRQGGDCFLAVPSGGSGPLAVSGLGTTTSELSELAAELAQLSAAPVDIRANTVTVDQCGALSFARALSPRAVPEIGIAPDRQTIESGTVLSGRIEKPSRRFLNLLLVDDTGTVQRFRNLVDNGDGTVGFSAPMTLIGVPVTTPQLLVAVASDAELETPATHEGLHADRYFAALAEEVERTGGEVEFGVTYFFVR